MPWSSENATEHTKSADTPGKRKKWATIANAALKSAKKSGKKQSQAEAYAIRVANAAMGDAFWNSDALFDSGGFVQHVRDMGWGPIDPDSDDGDGDPTDEELMRRHRSAMGLDPDEDEDDGEEDDDMDDDDNNEDEDSDEMSDSIDAWSEAARDAAAEARRAKAHADKNNSRSATTKVARAGDMFREAAQHYANAAHHYSRGYADMGKQEAERGDASHRSAKMVERSVHADSDYRTPYQDAVYDKEWTAEERKEAAKSGEAMPGGGFPIRNKADLMKARKALGRAKNRGAAIRHIKKRAKALGVDLGEDWPNKDSAVVDYRSPFTDAVYDREWTAEQRKEAAEKGEAMPGGGFPIKTKADLMKARHALGRAKNRSAAIKHIKKRAKALGVDLGSDWPNGSNDSAVIFRPSLVGLGGGASVVTDSESTVRMYDTITIDDAAKVRELDNGYVAAMPRVARTGIQIYSGDECGRPDMETVRVYRPPDSVFANDAVHSYTHLPMTLEHPTESVNSQNWKDYAIGETGDEVLRDGNSVRVPMMLRDAEAIKAFRDGKKQLSVGYDCGLLWQDGISPEGEQYDAIQRGIKANHIAVVGAARGGPSLTIGDRGSPLPQLTGDRAMTPTMMKVILVDGLELQVADASAPVIQRTIASLEAQLADAKKQLKAKEDEEEEAAEADAKKDAALRAKDKESKEKDKELEEKDGQIAALKKQLDEARQQSSPAALDAKARERSNVVLKARQLVGDRLRTDGMSVPDIRRAVVDAKIGNCKDWSDDRVIGAFDTLQANGFSAPSNQHTTVDDAAQMFGRPGSGYMTAAQAKDKALVDYDTNISNAWRNQQKTA